jgi:hypothetical protein
MKTCRDCDHQVSEEAVTCPSCGAPRPAKTDWDGHGFEYRSPASILGFPLLHVAFKFRPNGCPVPAVGVIAIGQFGVGLVSISQFGIGILSLGQITIAGWAVAQIAVAWELIAQTGVYVHRGVGQAVIALPELLERMT